MGHIHAELMAQYAEDAKEHDRPWELWEHGDGTEWANCTDHPGWREYITYRRKPRTLKIGNYEVPEPCKVAPELGEEFWTVNPFAGPQRFIWDGYKGDQYALNSGFVHLTEEAARQHYEAIKSLLTK